VRLTKLQVDQFLAAAAKDKKPLVDRGRTGLPLTRTEETGLVRKIVRNEITGGTVRKEIT